MALDRRCRSNTNGEKTMKHTPPRTARQDHRRHLAQSRRCGRRIRRLREHAVREADTNAFSAGATTQLTAGCDDTVTVDTGEHHPRQRPVPQQREQNRDRCGLPRGSKDHHRSGSGRRQERRRHRRRHHRQRLRHGQRHLGANQWPTPTPSPSTRSSSPRRRVTPSTLDRRGRAAAPCGPPMFLFDPHRRSEPLTQSDPPNWDLEP